MNPPTLSAADEPEALARDVAAIARLNIVPRMLKLICEHTGMGFAAVARVTDGTWTACAVEDRIAFGLPIGGQLALETTLCRESRAARAPIGFDHASEHPIFREHHTPRIYKIESYLSVPIVRADGKYFGNLCAIDPKPASASDPATVRLFTALAEMIAMQLTIDDALESSEREIAEQKQAAELREQFIAVLGHDLRNPLAAVGAAGEILARRPLEADRKIGERLRASTHRMGGLIDNLLDFARARMGAGIGVEIRAADSLAASLLAVVDEARGAHPEADIRDALDIRQPIACDVGRLQQLLSNLLGNAIHHGAQGEPITVSADVEGGELTLCVSNQGTAIAMEDLEKIFQPYWRPATSKPGGGLGLGLYICSQIVKAHGGRLNARSSADEGTVFTACIPVAKAG